MKEMKKILLTLMFGIFLTFGSFITTNAASAITQTSQTQNSVTINFAPSLNNNTLTGWTVSLQQQDSSQYYNWVDYQSPVNVAANVKTYTFNNLSAGTKYKVIVSYTYDTKYTKGNKLTTNQYIYTLPGKVSGINQKKWWYYAKSVDFGWDKQNACDYEYTAYNGKKLVSSKKDFTYNYTSFKVENNKLYKVKVRAYVTINGQVYYGDWSDEAYLFTQPMIKSKGGISINKSGKMTVKWNKISDISKYEVYVSTKETSGYKKVATVSAKKGSATIKKFNKKKFNKKKTYFVYIVANKKVGNNTYTSGRHYSTMYKKGRTTLRWSFDK